MVTTRDTADVTIPFPTLYSPDILYIALQPTTEPKPQDTEVTWKLSVGPGDSLELVLLLDGVRVRRSLSGVDELVGETLGDGFRVVESGFTGLTWGD